MMVEIIIYTTAWCSYCTKAKKLLDNKQLTYTEVDVSESAIRAKMIARTGGSTVPQILINNQAVGGCDELYALQQSGQLDQLLKK